MMLLEVTGNNDVTTNIWNALEADSRTCTPDILFEVEAEVRRHVFQKSVHLGAAAGVSPYSL